MSRVPGTALVVFDEAYIELVDSPDFPDSLSYVHAGQENVMVLRTFSKIYGLAGVRIGYAIANEQTLAPLFKVKEPFAVNRIAQAAGVAALTDDEFTARTVASNRAGREQLYNGFEKLGLSFIKSHTNFVLVKIGPQALSVQKELLKRGVIVRPCDLYDLPQFLRVSVGSEDQNARFLEALSQVMSEQ